MKIYDQIDRFSFITSVFELQLLIFAEIFFNESIIWNSNIGRVLEVKKKILLEFPCVNSVIPRCTNLFNFQVQVLKRHSIRFSFFSDNMYRKNYFFTISKYLN